MGVTVESSSLPLQQVCGLRRPPAAIKLRFSLLLTQRLPLTHALQKNVLNNSHLAEATHRCADLEQQRSYLARDGENKFVFFLRGDKETGTSEKGF